VVVELKPHQQEAVDKMHNGCVLYGGVGSGKTIASLAYWYTKVCGGVIGDRESMRKARDIYVITTAKKRDTHDWEDDAIKFGVAPDDPINSAGNVRLVVDSWNNVSKYLGVEGAFFVFDEQRAVGKGKWSKDFISIAGRNEWILLSATPGDTWLDYVPLFLANGFFKNRTEFTREHVVLNTFGPYPKVERYVGVNKLVRLRNSIVVHMPYERHTRRHLHDVVVPHDQELLRKVTRDRWHVYENRPLKDVGELFRVMRKVVNSDSGRLESVRELLNKHPKLIVFYNFDYELEMLRTLADPTSSTTTTPSMRNDSETSISSSPRMGSATDLRISNYSFAIAEWNGHKHQTIPKTDRWVYLVQYVAGSEGWNCIDTDAICFYSLTYSYKNFEQGQGRIDRMNTPFTDLHYYILRSRAAIDVAIARSLANKQNFNEGKYELNHGLAA